MSELRGLYVVTPDDRLLPRLSALVEMALEGGARIVQYRNKQAPPPLRRAQAAELLRICRAHDARLIINDDVWLAVEIGADGAHVGRDDCAGGCIAAARDALGPNRILGVSCYNELARAEAAAAAGADYVAFGSMYASMTKPNAVRAPLAILAEAKRRVALPVAAIGGVTAKNAPELIAAGADMLAVVSDLFDAMDIRRRAREFTQMFNNVESTPEVPCGDCSPQGAKKTWGGPSSS